MRAPLEQLVQEVNTARRAYEKHLFLGQEDSLQGRVCASCVQIAEAEIQAASAASQLLRHQNRLYVATLGEHGAN